MRPRRVVLLVETDPGRLLELTFLLDTWGYCVLPASEAWAIDLYLRTEVPDVLLTSRSRSGLDLRELTEEARQLHPDLRIILYAKPSTKLALHLADRFVPEMPGSPAVLRDALRSLVARKRGPKPRHQHTSSDVLRRAA